MADQFARWICLRIRTSCKVSGSNTPTDRRQMNGRTDVMQRLAGSPLVGAGEVCSSILRFEISFPSVHCTARELTAATYTCDWQQTREHFFQAHWYLAWACSGRSSTQRLETGESQGCQMILDTRKTHRSQRNRHTEPCALRSINKNVMMKQTQRKACSLKVALALCQVHPARILRKTSVRCTLSSEAYTTERAPTSALARSLFFSVSSSTCARSLCSSSMTLYT